MASPPGLFITIYFYANTDSMVFIFFISASCVFINQFVRRDSDAPVFSPGFVIRHNATSDFIKKAGWVYYLFLIMTDRPYDLFYYRWPFLKIMFECKLVHVSNITLYNFITLSYTAKRCFFHVLRIKFCKMQYNAPSSQFRKHPEVVTLRKNVLYVICVCLISKEEYN